MHRYLVKYELTHYFSLTFKCLSWLIMSTAYTATVCERLSDKTVCKWLSHEATAC